MESRPAAEPLVLPFDPDRCPFTATWKVIGGKWKGVLWWRLSMGLGRFSDLKASIPQVSLKVLTEQLRQMERDGVVHRQVYAQVPPRVEYSLTDHGRSLAPVMEVICRWGEGQLSLGDRRG